jgi:hypothetical protein
MTDNEAWPEEKPGDIWDKLAKSGQLDVKFTFQGISISAEDIKNDVKLKEFENACWEVVSALGPTGDARKRVEEEQ